MPSVTGIVSLVQESRFQLVDEAGRGILFMLAPGTSHEAQDLPELQRRQTRVTVAYTPARDRMANVAHRITAGENRS